MSQNITKIKARIKSVTGAYKVTSAMKLISTVKLKSMRYRMINNRKYSEKINDICNDVFSSIENIKSPYLDNKSSSNKNLYIVVSSSLGLCGSYNTNIFKVAESNIKKDDEAIILGNKGISHFKDDKFVSLSGFETYQSYKDSSMIKNLINYIKQEYLNGTYKEIHIIYTHYRNPFIFTPKDIKLLPFNNICSENNHVGYPPLMEPTPERLFEELVPIYLETLINSYLFESEVCEQAARSNAMENATNNAEELLDNLQIEFSKARQSAITQEIIEIVGASETL